MQQKQLVTICITICVLIFMTLLHLESLQPKTPESVDQVRYNCYKNIIDYPNTGDGKRQLSDCNNIK